MSQANTGAPTPRRSNRLSTKASSVAAESAITQFTAGGSKDRRKGALTKVKARKSNAYGASGRVGAAEEMAVNATGFAQAFEEQRDDAVARDESEEDEEDSDLDELTAQTPLMSGALNGDNRHRYSTSTSPAPGPGFSFLDSEQVTGTEDDSTSMANTSKSFGLDHEGGMLAQQERHDTHPSSRIASASTSASAPRYASGLLGRPFRPSPVSSTPAIPAARARVAAPPITPSIPPSTARTAISTQQSHFRQQRSQPVQPAQPVRSTQPIPAAQPAQAAQSAGASNAQENVADPAIKRQWSLKKFLWWLFLAFGVFTALFAAFVTGSVVMAPVSEDDPQIPSLAAVLKFRATYEFLRAKAHLMPPLKELDEGLRWVPYDPEKGEEDLIWTRMRHMHKNYTITRNKVDSLEKTLTALQEELPGIMIVRKHPNGRSEISDDFWKALISKVRSNDGSPEWIEFVKHTALKVKELSGVPQNAEGVAYSEFIKSEEFTRIIKAQYKGMEDHFEQHFQENLARQSAEINKIASEAARKAMANSVRLVSLAQTNLLVNYELNLHRPNYFSRGLGAFVIPGITSSTRETDTSAFARFWPSPSLPRNPPSVALSKWDEPGDCWCAAPNKGSNGKAQLAVMLGRPMKPTAVTIEHITKDMSPNGDLRTAPRDVELWVETNEPITSTSSHTSSSCQPEGPPGWQCLGTFKYNIHADNHVQTFDLASEVTEPVQKAMLRVTSNWGGDMACLYQVRLHGTDALPQFEHTVRLNDPIE